MKYEQGQWLIRRWAKQNGGETDFVRFENDIDGKKFQWSKFYRIHKRKVETMINPINQRNIEYADYRMSLQFRKATKSEIQKYAEIIFTQ